MKSLILDSVVLTAKARICYEVIHLIKYEDMLDKFASHVDSLLVTIAKRIPSKFCSTAFGQYESFGVEDEQEKCTLLSRVNIEVFCSKDEPNFCLRDLVSQRYVAP